MRRTTCSSPLLAATLLVAGCAEPALYEPFAESPLHAAAGAGPPLALNLYGAGGLARATPRTPCTAEVYRAFDFWLGSWDVFGTTGQFAGTNTVTSELDGCVVAEHWTGSGGVRGRSISSYDVDSGLWHQTWVTANTLGQLRLSGTIVDGTMDLRGVRESVFGFPFFNELTWTPEGPDQLRQVVVFRIPALGVVSEFTGIYQRVQAVTPIAEAPTTECHPGGISAETRRLDFLAGGWQVKAARGPQLGRSVVRTDLRDCLFEEHFTTSKGYEAIAFWYWDRVVGRWHRTYVDSEGERIELAGTFEGTQLVLHGTHQTPQGAVALRVTVEPTAGGGATQVIEISRDGGTTWRTQLELQMSQ